VIGEVKRFVKNCGLDTDVLYACDGHEPDVIVGDEIREIENALRGFNRILQRANFHHYIGSDLSLDPRTKPEEVNEQTERIGHLFRELNEKRIAQVTAGKAK
jgi:hypothetical protein